MDHSLARTKLQLFVATLFRKHVEGLCRDGEADEEDEDEEDEDEKMMKRCRDEEMNKIKRIFIHSCSDGVKHKETQSPALVCDRATAGSDPVHTGLPPVRGRFASEINVLRLPPQRTPGQGPAREPPNLLDLSRGGHLSQRRGGCCASSSQPFSTCTIH